MPSVHALLTILQAGTNDSDGLTLMELLGNVPVTPIALFTYVLMGLAVVGVYRAGRPRKPGSGGGPAGPSAA